MPAPPATLVRQGGSTVNDGLASESSRGGWDHTGNHEVRLLAKFITGLGPIGRSRQPGGAERSAENPVRRAPDRYAAVAIRPCRRACKEARAIADRRFLIDEAPRLPLPACNVHCRCAYETYPDRRDEMRRAVDAGISGTFYLGPDARAGLERRISDRGGADRSYYEFMRGCDQRR
jgi:hypothetical protein